MKHHLLALITLSLVCIAPAQDLKTLTPITGASVVPATDYVPMIDVSADGLKGLKLSEYVNIPGFFGAVSAIELGYLDGVTSGVQAQLNAKARKTGYYLDDYAVGDGVTDDTANFQAFIDALPAKAMGILGGKRYKLNGTVTINKQVKLVGAGAGWVNSTTVLIDGVQTVVDGATTLVSSSLTLNCLLVTGGGFTLEDVAIVNTNLTGTRPSAGAGIKASQASNMALNRVLINGFWNGVEVTGGHLWSLTTCNIYNYKNVGLKYGAADIPDGGDMAVMGCNFVIYQVGAGTAAAAVECNSSGGMRYIGNKINGNGATADSNAIGFLSNLTADAVTGVMIFSDNSVEGCLNHGLKMTGGSGASYFYPQISGNEFAGTSTGVELGTGVHKAHINDNVFSSIAYASIIFESGATYCVAGYNSHYSSPRAVWLKAGCVGCIAEVQNFLCQPGHTTNEVIRDETANGATIGNDAVVHYDYIQRLSANTPLAVGDVIVFQFSTGGGAGTFEVELQGSEVGQGVFLHRVARTYHRSPFDGTMSTTTIGTDISIGDAVDSNYITMDYSVAGYVIVKVTKTLSSVSTGTVRMKINGKPSIFILGPA